jgi:hypothetical protein
LRVPAAGRLGTDNAEGFPWFPPAISPEGTKKGRKRVKNPKTVIAALG